MTAADISWTQPRDHAMLLIVAHALLLQSAAAVGRGFSLLADSRDNITFAPYTHEQRLNVAASIYVHDDEKRDYYELESIVPRSKRLQERVQSGNMTDQQMHYAYSELVLSLRDFHTNYLMPAPHACYSAVKAISFQRIGSNVIKHNSIVVSSLSIFPEVIALSGNDISKVEVGDMLISIDGRVFSQYYRMTEPVNGGANEFGGLRAALSSLSFRSGRMHAMPMKNSTVFKLRSHKTRKTYDVTLPWVAISRDACIQEYGNYLKNPNAQSFMPARISPKSRKTNLMVHPTLPEYKAIFPQDLNKFTLRNTSDPIINYGIYEPHGHNLGIIKMDSFEPLGNDANKVVLLIRSLLMNELANTKSLVFDIRSNGGGLITMASFIPQLIKPDFINSYAHALVAPVNERLFLGGFGGVEWQKAYSQVKQGDRFTPIVYFDSSEESNQLGQAYYRPVGVFTDGNCYSACDLFSANMQDNGAAWIFGEDGLTGAGGANVVEYNGFLAQSLPKDFPMMPLSKNLPQYHQDMRVSWRQSVRIGKNKGKIIEDYGIGSNTVVRPQLSDVLNKNSDTQWARIATKLEKLSVKRGLADVYFSASPQNIADVAVGTPVDFSISCSGIDSVSLNYVDGTRINTHLAVGSWWNIKNTKKRSQFELIANVNITSPGFHRFLITAKSLHGFDVVKTFRSIRFIPNPSFWITLSAIATQISTASISVTAFNQGSALENGWNMNGSVIQVGNGIQYVDNVNTKLSIFANAIKGTKSATFTISGNYDTEKDYDYFHIGYTDKTGSHELLLTGGASVSGVSGKGVLDSTYTFKPQGAFEVYIQFIADGGSTARGVTINEWKLSVN